MKAAHTLIALSLAIAGTVRCDASIIINEFMAGNDTIVVPNAVPGSFDDWIEIHNTAGTDQDIGGWRLTDDPEDLNTWIFPVGSIVPANGYLIVFA